MRFRTVVAALNDDSNLNFEFRGSRARNKIHTSVQSMTVVDLAVVVSLKRDSSVIKTASRYEPETVQSFGHTDPVSVVPATCIYIQYSSQVPHLSAYVQDPYRCEV